MIREGKVPLPFEEAVVREMQEVFGGDKHHPVHPTFAQKLQTDLGKTMFAFCRVLCMQADQKQQDYGSENLIQFGPEGVLVRWADKLSRLRNLYESKRDPAVVTESAADTWRDGIVYDMIGYMMEAGLWPLQVTDRRQVFFGQADLESRRHISVEGPNSLIGEAEGSVSLQGTSSAPTHDFEELVAQGGSRDAQGTTFEALFAKLDKEQAWPSDLAGVARMFWDSGVAQGGAQGLLKLIIQSREVAWATGDREPLPQIGHVYKLRNPTPGRVCVVMVLPNYSENLTTSCVVFYDLNPQAHQTAPLQLSNHLRVEPVCWFNERYELDESAPQHALD